MPTVSVIIASYNHGKYISEAIESVLSQDYQDFEIVITDDGSADDSVAHIKTFTDPRIKLFCFPTNRGACTAMRNCLENTQGRYIAVLNSDDVFLPGKLTKQVRFLDAHPEVGAVFAHATVVDAHGDSLEGRTTPHLCDGVRPAEPVPLRLAQLFLSPRQLPVSPDAADPQGMLRHGRIPR